MNKKYLSNLSNLATQLGLSFDSQTVSIFGVHNGYSVCLNPVNETNQFTLSVAVNNAGSMPDIKDMKRATSTSKALMYCKVQGYRVTYTVRAGMTVRKRDQNVQKALEALTNYLRENNFRNCCQGCGSTENIEAYSISGAGELLCETCFAQRCEKAASNELKERNKKENVIGGIVGATLGSLLGVAAIVILGQMGYVSVVSGIVLGVCTLKGYELLGGPLTKKGIGISVILMLVMVYVGNRLDFAITVVKYYDDLNVLDGFRLIPMMIREQYFEGSAFYTNLALVYLFTLVGAVPTIKNMLREKKQANVTCKMTASRDML